MAGMVCTKTEDIDDRHTSKKPIRKIRLDWLSDDAAGTAELALGHVNGTVIAISTKPQAPAPDANYDVTVEDELGDDILEGAGVDRSAANPEKEIVLLERTIGANPHAGHPAVCGALTFKVAGAGNAKKGTAILYFR